jgi:hypothetical protein
MAYLHRNKNYLLENGVSGQALENMAWSAKRTDEGGLRQINLIGCFIVGGTGVSTNE